jgi:hypothetical protein
MSLGKMAEQVWRAQHAAIMKEPKMKCIRLAIALIALLAAMPAWADSVNRDAREVIAKCSLAFAARSIVISSNPLTLRRAWCARDFPPDLSKILVPMQP